MGFIISKGKSYRSTRACMINSQLYVLKRGAFRRVGYLNQNLFDGSLKSSATRETVIDKDGFEVDCYSPSGLCQPINNLLDHYPQAVVALPRLLKRVQRILGCSPSFQPNWFLPVALGGLGIDPRHASKVYGPYPGSDDRLVISRRQRLFAAHCCQDPSYGAFVGHCIHPDEISEQISRSRDCRTSVSRKILEMSIPKATFIHEDDNVVLRQNEDFGEMEWFNRVLLFIKWCGFVPKVPMRYHSRGFNPRILDRYHPISDKKIDFYRHAKIVYQNGLSGQPSSLSSLVCSLPSLREMGSCWASHEVAQNGATMAQ